MDLILIGRVVAQDTALGLPNGRVEVWESSGEMPRRVAATSLIRGGGFSLVIPEDIAKILTEKSIPLDFRLVARGTAVRVEPPVIWSPGDGRVGITLNVHVDHAGKDRDGARIVFGRVTFGARGNQPAGGVIVRAYDGDMRNETSLGEIETDRQGNYLINYSKADFSRAEKDKADLIVRVFDGSGKVVLHDPGAEGTVYNAEVESRIDIHLAAQPPETTNEYHRLLETLKPLTDGTPLIELTEDDNHSDITFLSREAAIAPAKIEHLVMAHRLGKQADADPAVLYALLRMDTFLNTRASLLRPGRPAIGIDDDARAILLDAARVDPSALGVDVKAAVEARIVPKVANQKVAALRDYLASLRDEAEEHHTKTEPKLIIKQAARFADPKRLGRIAELLQGPYDIEGLISEMTNGDDDTEPLGIERLQEAVLSGGLTLDTLADKAALSATPDKLALMPHDALVEVIRATDPNVQEKALSQRVTRITRELETRFPTKALCGRLRNGHKLSRTPKRTAKLIERFDDLRIESTNLDRFFAEKGLTNKGDQAVLTDLKRVQRVMRLAPDLDRTEGLLQLQIRSGADIVSVGKARFKSEIASKAGLSEAEAEATFARAETTHTAALMISGDIQATAGSAPVVNGDLKLKLKWAELSQKFPNLKTLFKGSDICECQHCRSVLSPAAYLVELIEYLGKRDMVDLTQSPPVKVNRAQEILFARRGEIVDIDLNCANAETPLPYIDIVCELLEAKIAPDAGFAFNGPIAPGAAIPAALLAALQADGWPVTDVAIIQDADINGDLILRDAKLTARLESTGVNAWRVFRLRQTQATASELAAAPEYVNADAYTALASGNFAFALPFDLNHVEARAYFDRFQIKRGQLMQDLATSGTPNAAEIASEDLELTDAQRLILITPNPAGQAGVWGLSAISVVADMAVVTTMLDKTGLSYDALDRLLQLAFIDPGGNLFIRHLDLSCDLDEKRVENLDAAALDRIHRFLRLQRATGWTDTVLDATLTQVALGAGTLDNQALIHIAMMQRIFRSTGLSPEDLTACFGEIAHAQMTGADEKPHYHKLFQNSATLGYVEPGLAVDQIDAGNTIVPLAVPLSAILNLSVEDFERLNAALTDNQLTFANLSRLYVAARLIDRKKLNAHTYLTLLSRTGHNPSASPAEMWALHENLGHVQSGAVSLADTPFVLEHAGDELVTRAITDDTITPLLEMLQDRYQTTFEDTKSPYDDDLTAQELRTPIKEMLLCLPAFTEDGANDLLRLYDADWSTPPDPAAAGHIAGLLDRFFDTSALIAAQVAVAAAGTPAALETAQKAMADLLLAEISTHLHGLFKATALAEMLAEFFRQDEELITPVLTNAALRQPGPAAPLVAALLTDNSLIDMAGDPPVPPTITPAAFGDQYRAVRLLHKMLPLVAAADLETEDLAWLLNHAGDMGWARLDALPYEIGQTAIAHADWINLTRAIALFDTYGPVPDAADPAHPVTLRATLDLLLPGVGTTQATWLTALARITGQGEDTLDDLDAYFGWSALNLDAWRRPQTWETMARALNHLRALGATVADAVSYIAPVLTAAQTAQLRSALKMRYADSIWLTTLGEITDTIRPQKRDALVAYLLATRDDWITSVDLYDHFLIDTEMEAKMPSSRIVQAHGTIQLFVERSRMGLESEAAADTSDTGWDQWQWMRNYRVWEANRKVFVYPENWIEPELLDNKSFLFQGLEDTLLQNEVNEITAEDAFAGYLEGLDGLSFLEVVAVCYQSDIYTMHIFARTKGGDPAQYYYRRFEKERYWSAWELVEVDITSNTLLAYVRRGRLNLAWPIFTEETKPDQDVTTPGVSESPSTGDMQNPEARLRIQLAVSEYASGQWKPRKISQEAIETPQNYSTDQEDLQRDKYNLLYNQAGDQIWLFHSAKDGDNEYHTLDGIFDVAGCKGYPEVLTSTQKSLRDFFPDYKDTLLAEQRYGELNRDSFDNLAIRNMITFWGFVPRLNSTPGKFRVTHPHVFTLIDLIYVILQILFMGAYSSNNAALARFIKLPFGTWLPYFFEDSNRAYVVVPGLYSREQGVTTKRTFSDFHKLIEDIVALVSKYAAKLMATPAPDSADIYSELMDDPDFLHVRSEILLYWSLNFGEQFQNLYHPLICPLRATFYKQGLDGLMARPSQLQQTNFDFDTTFDPTAIVAQPYPIEDVDFSANGSYSLYNWELFFHAPLMIAKRLASEQRFEEAMDWFHRIFNPTGTLEGTSPQKYWVTKPFYQATDADYLAQRIDTLLTNVADQTSPERHELEFAISEWRTKPFRPHVVARFRPVAYQRTVVMDYIGTLVDWGDYLFRQDTMESITQATQLYILADKLLGPKPRIVRSPTEVTSQTYGQLAADLGAFGNVLVELENYLPDLGLLPEGGDELPPPPVTLSSLYFCIPPNEKALGYWGTVSDRLFKIRNSQNIDGVERVLALFAPPIDPGMLVRAAASGLSLSSILAGMNAPLPAYRFQVMAAKASELTQEVRTLGNALMSALERKDAEEMALLRNDLEVQLLSAQRALKAMEIDAANEQIEVLKKTRAVTEEKNAFYDAFERINANEQLNLDKLGVAKDFQVASGIVRATGAVLGIIPDVSFGGHGAGGSPAVHATFGGSTLATVAEAAATVLNILSSIASYEGNRAGTLGRFDRAKDNADLQLELSKKELAQIDQQIVAAELRRDITTEALGVHDVQVENAQKISDAMEDKYTNKQLYQWMINDITQVYYRAYQLAYDTAKKAERCYQHELGTSDTFLEFGYWDSRKKGLQTANKLLHDIKRMEAQYLEANYREYEITKHVSLRQLDPLALVRLKTSGTCDFDIPEALYDMDHPGHYFRRVKSVAISIPCVAGPYASVSARLTQVSNRYRATTARAVGAMTPKAEYEETTGNDTRFAYNIGSAQSVATSSGQNDTGLFELSFRDDRYLPFEGTGAVGSWRLELPDSVRQFDYSTISDVIIHVRYTSRDGGSSLRGLADVSLTAKLQEIAQELSKTGMHMMVDLKRDYYNAWHELKSTGTTTLTLRRDRLPYFVQPLSPSLGIATILAKATGDPATYNVDVGAVTVGLNFSPDWQLNFNDHAGLALDTPFSLTIAEAEIAALEELSLVFNVTVP